MTTITLPPDLETMLSVEASRRGVPLEAFVIESLRKTYASTNGNGKGNGKGAVNTEGTLYDLLKPYIGVVEGPSDLSQDTGRKFGELVEEDYQRQQRDWAERRKNSP